MVEADDVIVALACHMQVLIIRCMTIAAIAAVEQVWYSYDSRPPSQWTGLGMRLDVLPHGLPQPYRLSSQNKGIAPKVHNIT